MCEDHLRTNTRMKRGQLSERKVVPVRMCIHPHLHEHEYLITLKFFFKVIVCTHSRLV